LVVINMIIKPVYILIIDRGVQNNLGPAEYGIFFALFNFSYLFHIINDMGIQSYSARYVAQNQSSVTSELTKFSGLKIWLGAGYLILVFLAALILGYEKSLYPILGLLALNHVGIGYIMYLRANLTGLGRYKADRILSIADRLFLILVLGTILLIPALRPSLTLWSFVIIQSISVGLSIIIGVVLLRDVIRWPVLNWSRSSIRNTLGRTWPYALTVFLMTLYTRMDGVMIERLLPNGELEAGIYASGYRLLDASNMVIFLVASILLPMFAENWKSPERLKAIFDSAFRLIVSICIPIAAVLSVYSEEFMYLLYDHATDYWGLVFRILILTFIPVGFIYLFSTYITASGKLKKMNQWFLIGILANIVLNLVLIPKEASLGAAKATLITQGLVAFLLLIECKSRLKHLPGKVILSVLFLSAGAFIFPQFVSGYLNIHFILESGICLAILFGFSLLMGLFNVKYLFPKD